MLRRDEEGEKLRGDYHWIAGCEGLCWIASASGAGRITKKKKIGPHALWLVCHMPLMGSVQTKRRNAAMKWVFIGRKLVNSCQFFCCIMMYNVFHVVYKERLTWTHVHAGCLWFACPWWPLVNSRHFVNFAAIVLQVGSSALHSTPPPNCSSAWQDIFRLHVKICLRAYMHMCVLLRMWGGLCFIRHLCPLRYFPRLLFLWKKPNRSCLGLVCVALSL